MLGNTLRRPAQPLERTPLLYRSCFDSYVSLLSDTSTTHQSRLVIENIAILLCSHLIWCLIYLLSDHLVEEVQAASNTPSSNKSKASSHFDNLICVSIFSKILLPNIMQQGIDNHNSIPNKKVLQAMHALVHTIEYESKYAPAKMHQRHPLIVRYSKSPKITCHG